MITHNGRKSHNLNGLSTGDNRLTPIDREEPTLTGLLRRHLFEVETDGKTRAQAIVEKWVDDAAEGNFKALQEILIRIDGEAKPRQEAAETVPMPDLPGVTALKAQKILDAFYDDRGDLPCD